MTRILLLGGTGLISVGIIKHLIARSEHEPIKVICFNRGRTDAKSDQPLPGVVEQRHGDRNDVETLLQAFDGEQFDVVIDMIGFNVEQAEATLRLCRHVSAEHLIFCSTVCTYGIKVPPTVIIDETWPQEPISSYGRNKLAAEQVLLNADAKGDVAVTVIRPSSTYGEGGNIIGQLEFDTPDWERIRQGLPVILAGDGLGLWNSTHRDDVGKLFAYAAGRSVTFGKSYNATTQRVFTWRDYYREAAAYFGKTAQLLFLPRDAIVEADAERFGLLRDITGYHGAYTSAAAMRDVPEFRCEVAFIDGVARSLAHLEAAGRLRDAADPLLDQFVQQARSLGLTPEAA